MEQGQIVSGFPTRMEARQLLELDEVPGTRYQINCMVVVGGQRYSCSRGRPGAVVTAVRRVLPPERGQSEGRVRDFERFEDFSTYTTGQPYTSTTYDPVLDAYPLFDIVVRRPGRPTS